MGVGVGVGARVCVCGRLQHFCVCVSLRACAWVGGQSLALRGMDADISPVEPAQLSRPCKHGKCPGRCPKQLRDSTMRACGPAHLWMMSFECM